MKKIFIFALVLLSLSLFGCQSKPAVGEINLFSSGLVAVEKDGKYGYIDRTGKTIIQFLYDDATPFYNDLAVVEVNGKMHVINKKGENILNDSYDRLQIDKETGNIFYRSNSKWGLMDKTGKVITDALYDQLYEFSEGRALVKSGSSYGFIDSKGKTVISIEYKYAESFSNGLALVRNDENKYGYIDKNGKVIIDYLYDYATSFDDYGLAIVIEELTTGDVYSLINKSNNKIINSVDYINGDGPLYEVETEDKIYLYKTDGTKFTEDNFEGVWYLRDYFGNVDDKDENDINVIFNKDGTILKSHDYWESDFVSSFIKGQRLVALVIYDDDFMDVYTYDNTYRLRGSSLIQIISNQRFIVERNGKYGLIDKDGNILIEFLYDGLYCFNDGYFLYQVNNKAGFMDSKYNTIVSATYGDVIFDINPIMW